jgi:hypothetical protein
MFIYNCPFGWKSEELNPKQKKRRAVRLAGTARRGCGGWEIKLLM